MRKNTKKKLFSKIAVFLMYGEIEIYPCICDYQTAYIAYWHLYCVKKWNNIYSNSMLRGISGLRVEPHGMVQPIAHNLVETETRYHMIWFSKSQRQSSKWWIKMAAPMNPHALAVIFANSEGIWNNYVDIQQKIMQVRFIILLCTQGYNSLVDPIRQHEVWRKILLNTNSWYLTEAFEGMHTLFLLTKSAAAHLFHWY